jgi:predicted site-specific integrase-resolvase
MTSPAGRQRYPSPRNVICASNHVYARVSSHDQKSNLITRLALLESYSAASGWTYEVLQDLGSGVDYHKRGLKLLRKHICSGEVGRWVLTHQDRQPAESRKPISASTPAGGQRSTGCTAQGNDDTGENQVSNCA